MSITIGIIEDNQAVIDSLSITLKANSNIKNVFFAKHKAEAMHMIRAEDIDVILLDLGLPDIDGQLLIPEIRLYIPNAKIIIFTNFLSSRHVIECMRLGVDGYLLKYEAEHKIIEKLMSAANGNPPISYEVNRIVMDRLRDSFQTTDPSTKAGIKLREFGITEKEEKVLSLLTQGLSIAAIASRINRSTHTVNLHLRSIYKKLNVHSRSEAVHVALAEGLISKP